MANTDPATTTSGSRCWGHASPRTDTSPWPVLYADAFASDPQLAKNSAAGHRYRAARAAALAGVGRGKDCGRSQPGGADSLAQAALDWLDLEVAAWAMKIDGGTPRERELGPAIADGLAGRPGHGGPSRPGVRDASRRRTWGVARLLGEGRCPHQTSGLAHETEPCAYPPPRSPGENFTDPGLMSVSVSLIREEIFRRSA